MTAKMFTYTSSYEGILERQRDPLNSVNNAGLETAGANIMAAMDGMQKVHDEATQNSGSGDSNFSNLSALENETDDFGRLLLQHQKDAKRLNNVVRGGKEQAFRRARPRPGVAERLEREERERLANGQYNAPTSNGGSPASAESEPPVTVPKEWGRRARKQTDWLKKIVEPSEDGNNDDVNGGEAIYERNTAFTGDLDWQDVANRPLRAIEQTPPSILRHQNADTPSSLNHMNTTLKPTFDFEDQDFTATSFLASTPAPTRYHRKIDELARQELEELEIKAVTTRTLDQIDSRSPNAVLRSRSNSKLRERANADRLRSPIMSPEKSSSPSRIPVRRQHLINNKENAPPNGYLKPDPKSTIAPAIVTSEDGTKPVSPDKTSFGIERRPVHGRNDSMSLLRKLARVSSLSPSPAKPKSGAADVEDEDVPDREAEAAPAVIEDDEEADAEPQADELSRPQPALGDVRTKHDNDDEEPKNFVSWNPDKAVFVEDNARTLAEDAENVVAEIPTPLDEDGQPLEITKSLENEVQIEAIVDGLAKVKPGYPRSALEAIVREAKLEREAQQFGESTIESLEDIVHPDLDPTITFDFDAGSANPEDEDLNDERRLSQAEKDRRQEDLAMEAMNKHLRTARTSIKDANRGLRRVENRIDTAEDPPYTIWKPAPPGAIVIKNSRSDVVYKDEDGLMFCETCGCHQRSVWKSLYLEFRSLFYTYDDTPRLLHRYLPISIRIRLTRLGTYIFLWWIWYIVESTLWAFYGTPWEYLPFLDLKEDEKAIFPFVIPTLLLRPFRPLWIPVREAMEAYYHGYFGDPEDMWSNGYRRWIPDASGRPKYVSTAEFDVLWSSRYSSMTSMSKMRRSMLSTVAPHVLSATRTVVTHLARATRSFVDAVDEAEYMWNDENLT